MSNPVEAAREVLLNGVAAFDFDAYEAALDAFEAAIRSDKDAECVEMLGAQFRTLEADYARLSSSDTER